jgi:hypothetical protein
MPTATATDFAEGLVRIGIARLDWPIAMARPTGVNVPD